MGKRVRQAPSIESNTVAPTDQGSQDLTASDLGKLILVVDDDPAVLKMLKRSLELEGYRVITADDGKTGLRLVEDMEPTLVILDVMMPGLDGFQVCERVRRFTNVPIIMLTAKGGRDEIVHGLEIGADDYLPKPFSLDELMARLKVLLRRAAERNRKQNPAFTAGGLSIDFDGKRVTNAGKDVALTRNEYLVLCSLIANAGKVLTHQQLLTEVWGPTARLSSRVVSMTIYRLRNKLGDDPRDPRFITTMNGVGYAFMEPVK
ncbi:MAG: response regulator transcription factor [Chloroflexi bacterium]|nr:response regulator transcription factor [Chloroflexota bacterium]